MTKLKTCDKYVKAIVKITYYCISTSTHVHLVASEHEYDRYFKSVHDIFDQNMI